MSRRISSEFLDGQLVIDNGKLKPLTHMKEYRKKQYAELERKLNDKGNEEHYALITLEEALGFLKSALCKGGEHKTWKDKVFACTDPTSSFAGNMIESVGVMKIINEFRSLGVEAKEYKGRGGATHIKITGKQSVRKFITGTNYRLDNQKILKIGIGSKSIVNGIVSGVKFCIIFSLAYRAVELMTKDEYALAEFLGNITVDAAKLLITTLVTATVGKVASSYFLAAGVSIIGVSAGLFFIGVGIAIALYYLDNEFGITDKVIKSIREADEKISGDYYEINRQAMALSMPAIWPWN
ncbi:hypothetical protein [Xenorhabdus miraniensis]|uniref:Inner membrane protein yafU n=1 Tax=Xenorhabdus miraniensis TaxID=351674 RepID=A0A2D0JWX3_9GAMM|nr:hypothetical protein [Xenorhabdus miraniensis]PHM50864.1 hypothetical protein Xmir_00274 [Xenorhabdus miraniensis]